MTLQLDPRYPMVWRSGSSVQFGIDREVARLDGVGFAQELMIDALRVGTREGTVAVIGRRAGASASEVAALLSALAPALRRPSSRPSPERRVAIDGVGPTAALLCSLLVAEGCTLVDGGQPGIRPDAVVIVASYAIAPARAARWLTTDVPHLAVVFGDESVRVGPFVEPGDGPCLHCLDRHRIDDEPDWPRMVVQLIGRAAPTETALASAYIAANAADLVLRRLHAGDRSLASCIRTHLDASGAFTASAASSHPECGCRSLSGIGTALDDSSGRSPTATTTAAAVAGPA